MNKIIEGLIKSEYLLPFKKREAISLNTIRKREIEDIKKGVYASFFK